ncbi:(2Fe-2S)-binding protein [Candidatus Xianfuyuplasma coldseepsis]|uniref:(2Fe-2S)-binding protein n=1 Tax=Candidatus Xianfuyuplasma coldseepsis TaxID=2782163 RepID=UPI002161A689|nr:(2Fe-2S)-binding protein [Xianfuyuplasma coldseepsis]
MRIQEHPILDFKQNNIIHFTYDGQAVEGIEGDTIASALHNLGIRKLSHSIKHHRARGFYCAIGNCASCNMIVNGLPNVRTCITKLEEGMVVKTQTDKGVLYEHV